jgi:hypothetical protein
MVWKLIVYINIFIVARRLLDNPPAQSAKGSGPARLPQVNKKAGPGGPAQVKSAGISGTVS